MLTGKLRVRSPSARLLGIARLEKFALQWNKRSRDGSGKCSINETGRPEDLVWGVVYEMSGDDKRALDRFEGLGKGYSEREVVVLLNGSATPVPAYYATDIDAATQPYDWYKEQVIAGALQHGLPAEYVGLLKATTCVVDPDPNRAARERSFLRTEPPLGGARP